MKEGIEIVFIIAFLFMGINFAILVAGRRKGDVQTIKKSLKDKEDLQKELDLIKN
jgi:hypothetical protein